MNPHDRPIIVSKTARASNLVEMSRMLSEIGLPWSAEVAYALAKQQATNPEQAWNTCNVCLGAKRLRPSRQKMRLWYAQAMYQLVALQLGVKKQFWTKYPKTRRIRFIQPDRMEYATGHASFARHFLYHNIMHQFVTRGVPKLASLNPLHWKSDAHFKPSTQELVAIFDGEMQSESRLIRFLARQYIRDWEKAEAAHKIEIHRVIQAICCEIGSGNSPYLAQEMRSMRLKCAPQIETDGPTWMVWQWAQKSNRKRLRYRQPVQPEPAR